MDNSVAVLQFVKPKGIKVIIVINAVAAVIHIIFWTLAFIKLPSPLSLSSIAERTNLAVSYGFGYADMVWSFPLLGLSAYGLWRIRFWGWFTAQLANMLWFYSFTVLVTKDLYTQILTPGTIIFLPFALFSIWIAAYLWKNRKPFMVNDPE